MERILEDTKCDHRVKINPIADDIGISGGLISSFKNGGINFQ